jgi:hypothetical protein
VSFLADTFQPPDKQEQVAGDIGSSEPGKRADFV